MKKTLMKSFVAIVLVIALVLSATSCAIGGIADQVNASKETTNSDTNYSISTNMDNEQVVSGSDLEATEKANPNGQADTFFKAMKELGFC